MEHKKDIKPYKEYYKNGTINNIESKAPKKWELRAFVKYRTY